MNTKKVRIIIAKPGLDGHDRGAKYIARALRDAGFEVIYTGLRQTPEAIVSAAIQEDAEWIGLSCLSGAHNSLFPKIVRLARERGGGHIKFFGGGVIPKEDVPQLKRAGIMEIFGPGTYSQEVVDFVQNH